MAEEFLPELSSMAGFRVEKVLSALPNRKFAAVLGNFGEKKGQAVVTLERKPFDPARIAEVLDDRCTMTVNFQNAEYSVYGLIAAPEHNEIKCDIIYPATEKHIAKYDDAELKIVRETPQLYREVTLPYILRDERGSRLQWVYNCLEKKKEVERLIFENPDPTNGFMLFPDMKWDQQTLSNLYCLAIINRRDISSLRDLSTEHLPLLKNIFEQGCQAILDRYKVGREKLRIYFHYPPTFYHLHVHFTHVDFDAAPPAEYMLETVMDNIAIARSDYYQIMPLQLKLRSTLTLYKELSKASAPAAQ